MSVHQHVMCRCGDAQDFLCPILNNWCSCTEQIACMYCRKTYPAHFPFLSMKENLVGEDIPTINDLKIEEKKTESKL